MMMDVHGLFATAKFGKTLAGYLGLFETLDIKIDKLAASELEAGIRALEQACNSEKETESLLREARSRFNKAISLEKNEKLAMAYFGLGLCHYYLGDIKNCTTSFDAIKEVGLSSFGVSDVILPMAANAVPIISLPVWIYMKHRYKQCQMINEKINSCKLYASQFFDGLTINNAIVVY